MHENLLNIQSTYLKNNANKIRWLAESKVTPTDLFCVGSGENSRKISVWKSETVEDQFEPRLLCEDESIDGDVTELKKLIVKNKWSNLSGENGQIVNSFDVDSTCEELCAVTQDGCVHFVDLHEMNKNCVSSLNYKESLSLNSVLYVKQSEIAVADSLGRIKLWDTRETQKTRSTMTLAVDGESSPILCLANHPNKQHLIASGNINGLILVYDVRSNNKPLIMCLSHSEPIFEVCFNPFSCDNLFSSSFDGALWFWNILNKNDLTGWNDKNVDAKNYLPNNRYSLNSFDVNNESIIAVNNNNRLFKLRNINFI